VVARLAPNSSLDTLHTVNRDPRKSQHQLPSVHCAAILSACVIVVVSVRHLCAGHLVYQSRRTALYMYITDTVWMLYVACLLCSYITATQLQKQVFVYADDVAVYSDSEDDASVVVEEAAFARFAAIWAKIAYFFRHNTVLGIASMTALWALLAMGDHALLRCKEVRQLAQPQFCSVLLYCLLQRCRMECSFTCVSIARWKPL
jgi:hypothetical protein